MRSLIGAFLAVAALPGYSQSSRPFTNKLSPYVASPVRAVELMLEMAKIKPGETLYDLGSGDGRIVIAAAEKYNAKAIGIEISPKLVASATSEIERAKLTDQARVIQGDVFQADLSGADVVTMYLDSQSNEKLKPRLEKFLKSGARVVSYEYPVPGWKAKRVEKIEGRREHLVYLYEIPASRQ